MLVLNEFNIFLERFVAILFQAIPLDCGSSEAGQQAHSLGHPRRNRECKFLELTIKVKKNKWEKKCRKENFLG